jgi:uncharacterized membrane protein
MSKIFLSSLSGKRKGKERSFYLRPINIYASIPLSSLFLLTAALAMLFKEMILILVSIVVLILFIIINLDFWWYLKKLKGPFFALKAGFVTIIDMWVMSLGVFATFINFIIKRGNI